MPGACFLGCRLLLQAHSEAFSCPQPTVLACGEPPQLRACVSDVSNKHSVWLQQLRSSLEAWRVLR